MADKNLRISVKSDIREGNKLTQWVKELQGHAAKLYRTLNGIRVGGGVSPMGAQGPTQTQTPQQANQPSGLTKQLLGDKKAIQELGREVDSLDKKFRQLGSSVHGSVVSTVARMQQARLAGDPDVAGLPAGVTLPSGWAGAGGASGGGGATGATSPRGGPGGPGGPSGAGGAGGAGGGPGGPGGPPAAPGAGPGGLGGLAGAGLAGMAGQLARYVGWGAIIQNLSEGFFNGPTRQIDWAANAARAQSGGNAAVGGFAGSMLRGNIMPAVGLMRAMGGGRGRTGFDRDDLEEIMNAAPAEAERLAERKGVSLNFVKGITAAGQNLTGPARTAAINQRLAEFVQEGSAQDPFENARVEMAMERAPGRVAFARRFGKDFSAATPLGSNVDPSQVQATVTAVLDALGTGVNIGRVTRVVTEATRAGMSSEAIQRMLVASHIGGGDVLARVYGSQLSKPMMERAGMAAADMASQSLLRINPETFVGGYTALGRDTDQLGLRQLQAGANFLNQVTTGQLDPYQKTQNMALATKKGRSVYTTQTLASMPINEMLAGALKGPTKEQQDAGVTKDDLKEQFNAVVNSLANRAVSEPGVKRPAGIQALLDAMKHPGGITGRLEQLRGMVGGKREIEAIQTGLNLVTNQQLGAKPLEYLLGVEHPNKRGEAPKDTPGRFGTALNASLSGQREFENDISNFKQMNDDLKAVTATFGKVLQGFGQAMRESDPDNLLRAVTNLQGLGTAMGDIAMKGPAAVDVLQKVKDFVDSVAAKKEAVEELNRHTMDFGQVGP